MWISWRPAVVALSLLATLGPLSTECVAQDLVKASEPVSVERVQQSLNRTPSRSLKFDARMPVPAATFRVTVSERALVVPIMESLRKEFELTPLQRQSAEWSSKCCGLSVAMLKDKLEQAIQAMRERRARDRVAHELAQIIAASDR
jgi:hypothetical protein